MASVVVSKTKDAGSIPVLGTMSDTKLHKLKGKTRRNIYGDDVPEEVTRFFDRKCGKIDGKKERKRKIEKELKKKKEDYLY